MDDTTNSAARWSLEDQHAAYRQGWGVFQPDGDPKRTHIERLDDPASLEDIAGLEDVAAAAEPIFASDADANAFVIRMAADGDGLARRALAHVAARFLLTA